MSTAVQTTPVESTPLMTHFDRQKELKLFDETKSGVKGLVDAGVEKLPPIFIHENKPQTQTSEELKGKLPRIDFRGVYEDKKRREEIMKQVKDACEKWGFFLAINHEIPVSVIDGILDGVKKFHEQDTEEKKKWYVRDVSAKKFYFQCNFDLLRAPAANWRDTISCKINPDPPKPEEVSPVVRDIIFEFTDYVKKFGTTLLELLSESLGLDPKHMEKMGCGEGVFLQGHYYPQCPQPELTYATSSHADNSFLTVLVQDELGGLQILHDNQWVDVPTLHGALIVNIGDLIQLITNDKFISVNHRVLAQKVGPRISVATFYRSHFKQESMSRVFGPIKELINEENPPLYKETTMGDYLTNFYNKGLDGSNSIAHLKINK